MNFFSADVHGTWLASILKIIRERERCTANLKKKVKNSFAVHRIRTRLALALSRFTFTRTSTKKKLIRLMLTVYKLLYGDPLPYSTFFFFILALREHCTHIFCPPYKVVFSGVLGNPRTKTSLVRQIHSTKFIHT